MKLQWIAFDAVGTLIFADPPVHLAYYRAGKRHGSGLRPEEVRRRFQAAFARPSGVTRGDATGDSVTSETAGTNCCEETEREFWRSVVSEVFDDVRDAEACFDELFEHFARPSSWQVFADVEETLSEAARRGIRLALASNFDARLHQVCDGLAELAGIERRVISSQVGSRKPEPRFYERLLEACGCRADELLVVGDDLENDVAAPRRLGIRSLQVDRSGSGGESLRSLTELWDVIEQSE